MAMQITAEHGAPAFGLLSNVMRDNLYWLGSRGFIFTSPWVVTPSTVRHAAVLLLSRSGQPMAVASDGGSLSNDAVAVAPLTRRGLSAMDVGLVSIHVFPPHPRFRGFQYIPSPGVLALDRSALALPESAMVRAYRGQLSLREAGELFDHIVAAATAQLPRADHGACGNGRLHELLLSNPERPLREIARELGLSYAGASRRFTRAVGLPLRSYRLWLKYFLAADLHMRGHNWTEAAHAAGFTDSSHLVKTWQASFGFSPSYTNDRRRVRIFHPAIAVDPAVDPAVEPALEAGAV